MDPCHRRGVLDPVDPDQCADHRDQCRAREVDQVVADEAVVPPLDRAQSEPPVERRDEDVVLVALDRLAREEHRLDATPATRARSPERALTLPPISAALAPKWRSERICGEPSTSRASTAVSTSARPEVGEP